MQEFCKEVCVDNIKDAMRAVDLGANRIEYCSKLSEEIGRASCRERV